MDDAVIERLRAYDPFEPRHRGEGSADSPRRLPYLVLDVFTRVPLAGNAVAVFADGRDIPGETMQLIAREMNLSETVFALAPEAGGDVRIRIFTPTSELPFAGHPTLGAAVVAGAALQRADLTVETGAGPVAVTLAPAGDLVTDATMVQPLPTFERFGAEAELLAALGVTRSRLPVEVYRNGPSHVLVALADLEEVAALSPDLPALERLGEIGVSCFAGAGAAWTTRMFAPALGVAEDPATGSAAGPIAVHLARHGETPFGAAIELSQGAAVGRPSQLRALAHGTPKRIERVEVGGSAVVVARAEMRL